MIVIKKTAGEARCYAKSHWPQASTPGDGPAPGLDVFLINTADIASAQAGTKVSLYAHFPMCARGNRSLNRQEVPTGGERAEGSAHYKPWRRAAGRSQAPGGDRQGESRKHGWLAVQASGTATVTFEAGPAVPPLGEGSVEPAVGTNGNSGAKCAIFEYAGTKLSDLTTLRYSTYVDNDSTNPLAGPDQTPYMILNVDLDGNLSTAGDLSPCFSSNPNTEFGYTLTAPTQGPDPHGHLAVVGCARWRLVAPPRAPQGARPGGERQAAQHHYRRPPKCDDHQLPGLTGAGGVRIVAGFAPALGTTLLAMPTPLSSASRRHHHL